MSLVADPLSPSPPEAPRFDPALGSWVLSRYWDVLAALREPAMVSTEAHEQSRVRSEVVGAITHKKLVEWRAQIEAAARDALDRLGTSRPVDVVQEFVKPWSRTVAVIVDGADAERARQLLDPKGDLRNMFPTTASKSLFMGTSETLASFLSNALLALIRHPAEFSRLRAEPDLMPRAIEELLRYAGVVHTLVRQAAGNAEVNGLRIASGEKVLLKLASANRDPESFFDPDRLDLGRRLSGHAALGAGQHSCAGALLVRMATAVALSAFTSQFSSAQVSGTVSWHNGTMLFWPESLPVTLTR